MDGISLNTALAIDLVTLAICAYIALRVASSLVHPAPMGLACHCYIVTVRLIQLEMGFRPMAHSFAWPVGVSEVVRASLASDAALAAMAVGWLVARHWKGPISRLVREPRVLLSPGRVRFVAFLAVALALVGIALIGPRGLHEAAAASSWESSGYLRATTGWAGWGLCLLHYLYGFPPALLATTAFVLGFFMLFNAFRGVVIIPAIFLILMWLSRRAKSGIPWSVAPAVVLIWLVWLPMKPIVYGLQGGLPVVDAVGKGVETAFRHLGEDDGSGVDFQFLDMIASTMTLVDIHGVHYYGSTFYPLLVSPVPRMLWPDKPRLPEYQYDLDIPSRAMAKLNMTAGLVGEAYANFGWFGIALVPFLLGLAYAAAFHRLQGTNILGPGCLLYLFYVSTFMQVYRDGLISAVWFPFVHCAPLGWLALSHWIWPPQKAHAAPSPDEFTKEQLLPCNSVSRWNTAF